MRLVAFILLGYLPILGGVFTAPGEWYQALAKAPFHPPGWVFGPVWTLLFLAIGIALWRHDRALGGFGRREWALVAVHHLLNAAWTPLFFGLQAPVVALVDIVLLALVVAWFGRAMLRSDRLAAGLFAAYLLWVLFATVLNAWIVAAN